MPVALPLGAPGKALLAFLPWERQQEVLGGHLEQVLPRTITDPVVLADQFAQIRERGFALSMAERTPGIRSVAAPVFGHSGQVAGCLSVSGPEQRMPVERMEEFGMRIVAAAWSVSELLGATPVSRDRSTALAGSR
jgi:IclR family acetate operon transcriptional repressor